MYRVCHLQNRHFADRFVSLFTGVIMAKKEAAAVPQVNIGISDKDRKKIAEGLSRLLADTYTLYLKTHNFHWNVTGPMFQTLHVMFMEQYTELWNALDDIAERISTVPTVKITSSGHDG